jgi:hypothetical protein
MLSGWPTLPCTKLQAFRATSMDPVYSTTCEGGTVTAPQHRATTFLSEEQREAICATGKSLDYGKMA